MTTPTLIAFQDDYEHNTDQIEYILENELMPRPKLNSSDNTSYQKLEELYNTTFASVCLCSQSNECNDCTHCLHGGNYFRKTCSDGDGELVLNPNRRVHDLIYECFSACNCSINCGNRLVQFGPRTDLSIISSPILGRNQLGLVSRNDLSVGAFICEYAGELLTASEAQNRHSNSKPGDMNYIVCLIERSTGKDQTIHRTFIDPTRRGNIGRYLNHSCDPNCKIISVRVDGPIPRLGNILI